MRLLNKATDELMARPYIKKWILRDWREYWSGFFWSQGWPNRRAEKEIRRLSAQWPAQSQWNIFAATIRRWEARSGKAFWEEEIEDGEQGDQNTN
jgi:hypothetical protein